MSITVKVKKDKMHAQMVTHLSADLAIHSYCPHCWLMLILCIIEAFNLEIVLSLFEIKTKFAAHPSLKWPTFVKFKHDAKVKAVRVNSQITEVMEASGN